MATINKVGRIMKKSKEDEAEDRLKEGHKKAYDKAQAERAKRSGPKGYKESGGNPLTALFRLGFGRITGRRSEEDKKLNR